MKTSIKFKDLIQGEKAVLVGFYASWCGPCKMMPPILKEVASMMGDQEKIFKVIVEKNPKAATDLRIQGVPTLVLFQKGKILWRQSGVVQAQQLAQIINTHLKKVA
ncbi:thioredoxin 1 [Catalinimonas alkaloidigena]|uniref:thioredoxin family protein n=1 Tax=Catalinimonas alkaloidigena TaxID=1075417 RepID=UPI0024076854|nr:thioredoxin domain-containing protein [Catalinimonas alkaloidigena]MDF9797567.1 thioredoxin 1 [Catalinimonas alkaloidigena]